MRTALLGAPRPREGAPGSRHGLDSAALVARAYAAAGVSAAAFAWAAAGALAWAFEGRVGASQVAALGIAPAAVLFVALLPLAGRSRGAREAASVAGSLLVVLAVAGHLLGPRGEPWRSFFAPGLGPAWVDGLAVVAGLALAPLVGATLVATSARRLAHAGAPALSPPTPSAVLGAYRFPGLLLADLALTLARRPGRATERVALDAPTDRVGDALRARGWTCDAKRGSIEATPPDGNARAVRIARKRPFLPAQGCIEVVGEPSTVRRARLALDDASFVGLTTSTRTARRLEATLNALHAEAQEARTVEERAALLLALDGIDRSLARRPILSDEWTALAAWKSLRLRALLQDALLRTPPDAMADAPRVALAPAPALAPDPARVIEAGGMGAATRLVHVPYHLVPVQTPSGEVDALLDALTERYDPLESDALLQALRDHGARLRVDEPRPVFLPAPAATGALVSAAREGVRRRGHSRTAATVADAETLYVPFVVEGLRAVNAVTGREADPALFAEIGNAPRAQGP